MSDVFHLPSLGRLEELSHEQLLTMVRRLLGEADSLSSRIAAVNEIGLAINQDLNLPESLRIVSKQAKWLLDFDYCGVCLHDEDSLWYVVDLFGCSGVWDSEKSPRSQNLGYVLKNGMTYLGDDESNGLFMAGFASQMILPLTHGDQVLGAICFGAKEKQVYTHDDLRVAHLLALQLSSAIYNAYLLNDLKMAEEGLRSYSEELERRNAELDAYNHTIAHDLKSPLTAIPLRTYMIRKLLEKGRTDQVLSSLDEINDTTQRMTLMIEQLLWLAKLRNPAENAVPVDVEKAVAAAVGRFSELFGSKGIKLEVMPDLPSVVGHVQWLEEVFANLISNAIKYMGVDNPAPLIEISATPEQHMICYRVRDTGMGIPLEKQAHLFEMFTRVHPTEAEGLGLGLSIVHRIITNLNGELGVESVEGEGSTFWFKLPAVS